jgi:uncharacterized surface protein with fasciclin (FAS1) repeats
MFKKLTWFTFILVALSMGTGLVYADPVDLDPDLEEPEEVIVQATQPSPADGAANQPYDAIVLEWTPGSDVELHTLFLGTSSEDVAAAEIDDETLMVVSVDAPVRSVRILGHFESGQTYYWRVDAVSADPNVGVVAGDVWSFTIETLEATQPSPADGATGLPRDDVVLQWTPGARAALHNLYLGTSYEDVATADVDANDVAESVVAVTLDAPNYAPGPLAYGQTYYWRVDEVAADPDVAMVTGAVWSFTVQPYSTVIANVTVTASSAQSDVFAPERTIDGSGLDENNLHSANGTTMWLSSGTPGEVVFLEYAFDQIYRLDKAWIWNSNTGIESLYGYGLKDVTIETSMDGVVWAVFGDVEFPQAPGAYGYAPDTLDMAGAAAKYVRFVANSNWGGGPRYGLSEVRFFAVPVLATDPQPASGTVEVPVDATLSWAGGLDVVSHELYLSSNRAAVENGTALVAALGADTTSFNIASLGLNIGTTYYWKVNEVNEAYAPRALGGEIWSFRTQEHFAVDNFESYTSATVKNTWRDGWKVTTGVLNPPSTGSPVIDQEIAHSGNQSVFLAYDNSKVPYHVQILRGISGRTNWEANGVRYLVLFYHGDPGNHPGDKLFAEVNGKRVNCNHDLSKPWWRHWSIDLKSLNINLRDIRSITVGVGDVPLPVGRKGKIWIDDIRLYRDAPSIPTIVDSALAINSSGEFAGQFDTLLAALSKADPAILEALSSEENYTVFAPTNDAFAALAITAGNVGGLDVGILNEILLGHVAAGKLMADDVLATDRIDTIQGAAIRQADGTLTDAVRRPAGLVAVDGVASNGVIHVVDSVLLPFETRNIVEKMMVVNQDGELAGQLDALIGVVQSDPSLLALLTGTDEYTVFAPTTAAIELLRMDADENLLTYHIAPGTLLSEDVLAAAEIQMLNGGMLNQAGGVLIDAAGRQVQLVATDVIASNGVVHVVDAVLLPVPVIVNASFELPGTDKQLGFDEVAGWATDGDVVDSGVEMGWGATDGEWTAYLMSGDPAVWQMTPLTLGEGDLFTLKVDARITWAATTLRMTLYYLDDGVRIPAATADVALTDSMQEYALALNAYEAPDAVGKTIGIEFQNVSAGDSWIGLDRVRLEGPTAAPEPEPEPEPSEQVDVELQV